MAIKKISSGLDLKLFLDEPYVGASAWDVHISWKRHLPEPLILLRVVWGLLPIVLWGTVMAVLAVLLYELGQVNEAWGVVISAPGYSIIFSLTSFVLSLLLVFRTNSAYGRWSEVRQSCGAILNCVRNTQRLAMTWLGPEEEGILRALTRWNCCLGALAYAYLCQRQSYFAFCKDHLTEDELAAVQRARQPPIFALTVMSSLLRRASLTPWERASIEEQLSKFETMVGACERIASQPLPLAYTRHTSRFLVTWLTWLPFGLAATYGWLTIPICAAVSFLLASVENVGVQIEQPLRVLPLARFAEGAQKSVLAQLAELGEARRLADKALWLAMDQGHEGV